MAAPNSQIRLSPRMGVVRWIIATVALLGAVVAEIAPDSLGALKLSDEWLRDQMLRATAQTVSEPRIAVVDIDEASLAEIGPWPWPRAGVADLAELLLGTYQARAVALDFVMPEPADGPGDARLAALSGQGGLVLAHALDFQPRATPLRVGKLAPGIPATAPGAGGMPIPASGFIANHAGLAHARCVGNIGVALDQEGVVRRLPLLASVEGRTYPTLSLALLQCARTSKESGMNKPPAVPAGAHWRIPYDRTFDSFTVVRASDVLRQRLTADNASALRERLVLVGSSALGLSDRVATPLSASTSGVLVHAAALAGLMDAQAGLAPAPWPARWIAIAFALFTVLIAVLAFPRLSAPWSIGLLAALTLLWVVAAFVMGPHDGQFSTAGPFVTLFLILVTSVPFEWRVAQLESRRLLDIFGHYVAGPVLDELLRNHGAEVLEPRHMQVTTLVADMEGYAGMVEGASLPDAVALTRGFLDCLTRPVLDSGGTLDKYTGDGLMAFWGAPLPADDHADRAIDAAKGMLAEVDRMNLGRAKAGLAAIRVRVGIESGAAVAGDLGTPFRSTYTAVGDSVNVASRLQEFARDVPYDIVVGAGAARLVTRHRLKPLGSIQLRGRSQPEELYTPESLP